MAITDYVSLLTVGEVGDANVQIQDSVTSFNYELTADMVSQITFTVHDPDFDMYNRNYFVMGRRVVYNNVEFEIAAVALSYSGLNKCKVTARTKAIQEMRRDLSRAPFGNVAPSQAASQAAALFGLGFFGESSRADGNIQRQEKDDSTESTYAVLNRLAKDLNFRLFEAKGVLFFASEQFIVNNQPKIDLSVPSTDTNSIFVIDLNVRKSTDGKKASTFDASLIKNDTSIQVFPGMGALIKGIAGFEMPFMIDKVAFDARPNTPVKISGTSIYTEDEINCTKRVFSRGADDNCVKRIQQAVGATVDGQFGPQTERLVKQFQNDKIAAGELILPANEPLGTVGAETWREIVYG